MTEKIFLILQTQKSSNYEKHPLYAFSEETDAIRDVNRLNTKYGNDLDHFYEVFEISIIPKKKTL